MNFLVVGKGAREHAIAWKLSQSKLLSKLFLWPGNPLAKSLGESIDLDQKASAAELAAFCKKAKIDLVVVGPEAPLADGIADILMDQGVACFGPKKQAAKLEASKAFAKEIMQAAGIPTARYDVANTFEECAKMAKHVLQESGGVVLKASGLAAGKGVFVCRDKKALSDAFDRLEKLGEAARQIVVEELINGRESSYLTLLGQEGSTELGLGVDFKRLKDGDAGPNTGGMGGYSPVGWLKPSDNQMIEEQVVAPLLNELGRRKIDYCGCLYVGLMWTAAGLKVIEFNVRLGDPEAQLLALGDDRDWGELFAWKAGIKTKPAQTTRQVISKTVAVVMASSAYPYGEEKESSVALPSSLFSPQKDLMVFGASVSETGGKMMTGSGRVLTVVGKGATFDAARNLAYGKVHEISKVWSDARWRSDIAAKA